MWVVLIFIFVVASQVSPSTAVTTVALIAMIVLGGFNTASMVALVRRYSINKEIIYRPDIVHLDLVREQRRAGR